MKKQNLLSKAEMKKVMGGIQTAEAESSDNCIIYYFSEDGRRLGMFETAEGDMDGKAAAIRAHQVTGQHTYWDCGDRDHKYYVS